MTHMLRKTQNLTHAQELVTLRTGRPVAELLREMHGQGLSQGAMAEILGVSRNTVAMWLREFAVGRDDAGPVEATA